MSKKLFTAPISPKNSLVEETGHENPVWETKEQKVNNFLLPANLSSLTTGGGGTSVRIFSPFGVIVFHTKRQKLSWLGRIPSSLPSRTPSFSIILFYLFNICPQILLPPILFIFICFPFESIWHTNWLGLGSGARNLFFMSKGRWWALHINLNKLTFRPQSHEWMNNTWLQSHACEVIQNLRLTILLRPFYRYRIARMLEMRKK